MSNKKDYQAEKAKRDTYRLTLEDYFDAGWAIIASKPLVGQEDPFKAVATNGSHTYVAVGKSWIDAVHNLINQLNDSGVFELLQKEKKMLDQQNQREIEAQIIDPIGRHIESINTWLNIILGKISDAADKAKIKVAEAEKPHIKYNAGIAISTEKDVTSGKWQTMYKAQNVSVSGRWCKSPKAAMDDFDRIWLNGLDEVVSSEVG